MKLLVDMNLSPSWVAYLQSQGVEAEHWSAIGPATAPDREILAHAERHGFVVFTHDLDFGAILASAGLNGPSVIQLRGEELRPAEVGPAVVAAARQCRDELARGALLTIDAARYRVTLLPLRT